MVKGIQKYVAEHILPTLVNKEDQTLDKVIKILEKKYGRSRIEQVEEAVEEIMTFREDTFEEDDDLIMAMRELNQRRSELKMTFEEFLSVWMFGKIKKRKKMEGFEIQALREVVKENSQDVVQNFEQKFKEIHVEGKRKSLNAFSTLYTDKLPTT